VVLADSHGISRAPYYLGSHHGTAESIAATGLTPPVVRPSNRFAYAPAPRPTSPAELVWMVPRPRPCNARRLSHMDRFSPIRFRSPLLTESLLFSLPAGTEMFHFPAFPPRSLCVQLRVVRHNTARGFPIRKSWPQRPVIDSTRLIADSHVLLRLPMPRHPPCALENLTTNRPSRAFDRENHTTHKGVAGSSKKLLCKKLLCKMLASTMQFPNNNPPRPATTRPQGTRGAASAQENLETKNQHHQPVAPGLLSQDPTVCQKTPDPPTGRRSNHPPARGGGVPGGQPGNQRPNPSTFHP
jgi:hypothetical protein